MEIEVTFVIGARETGSECAFCLLCGEVFFCLSFSDGLDLLIKFELIGADRKLIYYFVLPD
jgi:hypothetical protein